MVYLYILYTFSFRSTVHFTLVVISFQVMAMMVGSDYNAAFSVSERG